MATATNLHPEDLEAEATFRLSPAFVRKYKDRVPPFGFNGLGEVVFFRTYSRIKPNGRNEVWWETVRRVTEGCYRMQELHIKTHALGWDSKSAQKSAQEMFDRMFNMKFLPPGRGLWSMGSELTENRGLHAALFNCSFRSTANLDEEGAEPFCYVMDASMLGIGVGFDVKGEGCVLIQGDSFGCDSPCDVYRIPDTREGWVESVRRLINSHLHGYRRVRFEYDAIRAAGEPIKGFGGVASGPAPLQELHEALRVVLEKNQGRPIKVTTIVDIMNLIGRCVVAGNVRRTALLSLGDAGSAEYIGLKNYRWDAESNSFVGPAAHRSGWGWTSNNSVSAELGMDYTEVAARTALNGEPGYVWLENMRTRGRMSDPPRSDDSRVAGTNPCFAAGTLIAVADGRGAVAIEELARHGTDVPVYSVNDAGKVQIKWGRCPRKTRDAAPLLRILLDDGTTLDVTPDHKMRMLDGAYCFAEDLKPGDSLPRFTRYAGRMHKDNPSLYLRVNCDTLDDTHMKPCEHRLIAEFHQPEEWARLYDEQKQSGWAAGGLVIHHVDYDGTNNRPENLKIVTYREHGLIHGQDRNGPNNGMFGRSHSAATRSLIGSLCKSRWADPEYAARMKEKIHTPDSRRASAEKLSAIVRGRNLEYYEQQQKISGLETVMRDGRLYAKRLCRTCGETMLLPWRERTRDFCSRVCVNKSPDHTAARKRGQTERFRNRQQQTMNDQVKVFKDLQLTLSRRPMKKEWESECRSRSVSFRFNPKSTNPFVLGSFGELEARSEAYNHRVVSVTPLEGAHPVYNLTVDDNHTVGIVTDFSPETNAATGIYTFQCSEIQLEDGELCNLTETFPANHDDLEDFRRTIKFAYLYSKTVTLSKTPWEKTNRVMLRNRRIGLSMSGIQQFVAARGLQTLREWCESGYETVKHYDEIYSDWLAVPRSKRLTCVKPSGTVSILSGSTPGLHWPEALHYLRRVRLSIHSDLVAPLREAGYPIEPAVGSEDTTLVVSIPVKIDDCGGKLRTVGEVGLWEQVAMAAFMQRYWADNQVSVSVTFDADKESDQIAAALNYFQWDLKGISFLPRLKDGGAYPQMPYEEITAETYECLISGLKPLTFSNIQEEEAETERFCDNSGCQL